MTKKKSVKSGNRHKRRKRKESSVTEKQSKDTQKQQQETEKEKERKICPIPSLTVLNHRILRYLHAATRLSAVSLLPPSLSFTLPLSVALSLLLLYLLLRQHLLLLHSAPSD